MLWTVAVVLLLLWALGMVSATTMGGFIHVLPVLAIVLALARVLRGAPIGRGALRRYRAGPALDLPKALLSFGGESDQQSLIVRPVIPAGGVGGVRGRRGFPTP